MARPIDADALKERFFNYYSCVNEFTSKSTYTGETLMDYEVADMIEDCIENAPTVDAVPVVRCKDCTQWGGVAFGNVCRRWSAPLAGMKNCTGPDDFCSYGKRRTDNA